MRRESGAVAGVTAAPFAILAFALLVLAATRGVESGWAPAAWLAVFVAMGAIHVPREEALMRARFGAAYDDYCREADRLMPRVS
ncbi:MAG: hypothetical protein V4610_21055 [Pseudomonadota bacterium]|jgi:protein-S-isoprenylcysteine O-methyltransferase Ste14|uniref:Isoprenylcysteine carboxylmethyltransferase family protein n=1 Tax=hydrothermal vent metagenome TaxID=652676 RepID=A0A160TJ98_9ZZZZ